MWTAPGGRSHRARPRSAASTCAHPFPHHGAGGSAGIRCGPLGAHRLGLASGRRWADPPGAPLTVALAAAGPANRVGDMPGGREAGLCHCSPGCGRRGAGAGRANPGQTPSWPGVRLPGHPSRRHQPDCKMRMQIREVKKPARGHTAHPSRPSPTGTSREGSPLPLPLPVRELHPEALAPRRALSEPAVGSVRHVRSPRQVLPDAPQLAPGSHESQLMLAAPPPIPGPREAPSAAAAAAAMKPSESADLGPGLTLARG